jgi:hypothetical protein
MTLRARRTSRLSLRLSYCTITVAPIRTLTSSLVKRMQPDDTACPILSGSLEP